jgi:hypothetical protein
VNLVSGAECGMWIVVLVKRVMWILVFDEEWGNVDCGSGEAWNVDFGSDEDCENVDCDIGLTVTANGTFSCSSDRYF